MRNVASVLSVGAIAALLASPLSSLRLQSASLGSAVEAQLDASGVTHPVTAVLLNFRAYDTWLELVVLLLAACGALQGRFQNASLSPRFARDPLVRYLLTALVPLMALAAGYLLLAGTHAPGGAFQAGAVLAAALVLLHLAGRAALAAIPAPAFRVVLVLGPVLFAAAAVTGLAVGGSLLQYPPQLTGLVIVVVESAAAASIAATLAALVIGQMDA